MHRKIFLSIMNKYKKGKTMEDFTPPKNDLEDAQIKFKHLADLANALENQETADISKQQIIISSILKSENKFLTEILENALFDDAYSEYLKTIIAGLLWNKKETNALIKLVHHTFDDKFLFNEKSEKKESLLLVLEALAQNPDHEDTLNALKKLYLASTLEKNDCPLADRLLGRCINVLPGKSPQIDEMLVEIIKDKNIEINPKIIAIDILTRSKGGEVFPLLQDIIFNIKDYIQESSIGQIEMLYLLDVITKDIKALMEQGVGQYYGPVIEVLNNLQFIPAQDSENLLKIANRIEERIEQINELHKKTE